MRGFRRFCNWAFGNLGNFVLLGGWLVSLGFFPTLLAIGKGATPLQYGLAAVSGLLVFYLVTFMWARIGLWRAQKAVVERLSSESSPFDPMDTVFRSKRIFLKDLAPAGRRHVAGKTFIDCEIIGPGIAMLGTRSNESKPWPVFKENLAFDVDCVEIDPAVASQIAIYFPDCDFTRCHFYHMALLFSERFEGSGWHWITPDRQQPLLLPDTPRITDPGEGSSSEE